MYPIFVTPESPPGQTSCRTGLPALAEGLTLTAVYEWLGRVQLPRIVGHRRGLPAFTLDFGLVKWQLALRRGEFAL